MKKNLDPLLYSSDNDADGDEKSDLEEFIDSTDPNKKDSEGGFPIWVVIVIALVLLLLLIGGGIGVFLFIKKKGESEPTQDIMDAPPEDTNPAVNDNVADPIQDTS